MRKRLKLNAFTLAETLVAMMLFSILILLIVVVLQILFSFTRLSQENISKKSREVDLIYRLRKEFDNAAYVCLVNKRILLVRPTGDTTVIQVDSNHCVLFKPGLTPSQYNCIDMYLASFMGKEVKEGLIDQLIFTSSKDSLLIIHIDKWYDAKTLFMLYTNNKGQ